MALVFPLPLTWESPDEESAELRTSQLGREGVRLTEPIGTGALRGNRQAVFTFAGDDTYQLVKAFLDDRQPFHLVPDVSAGAAGDPRVWVLEGGYSFDFPGPGVYRVSFTVLRIFEAGQLGSLTLTAPIELFEISNFNRRSPGETIYIANYVGVDFEGQTYEAIGCEGEGFDLVGKGSPPEPRLTISNIGRFTSDFIYRATQLPGYLLEGATVTRRLTQRQFLDGQPGESAAVKEDPPSIYQIEQLEEETDTLVRLRLGMPGFSGLTLPSRPALRRCPSTYRGGDCGYAGAAMFDRQNNPTLDPTLDVCAQDLIACELRFGANNTLNFGGFPGLQSYG
jgi:lambda family phage minor tail protein L